MSNSQQLVLAFFENQAAAESAVKQLEEWDKSVAGVKFDNIGILVKDDKGKVKAQMQGPRRTGVGIALGAIAGVLTGGISLIAGALIGGVLGHFVHKGLGLSKEDLARISGELDGGKAAVGVLVDETQVKAVTSWITDLGGKTETHAVSDEGIEQAASALQSEPEVIVPATAETPPSTVTVATALDATAPKPPHAD